MVLLAGFVYIYSAARPDQPITFLPTPTPSFLPTSSEETKTYQDEEISFQYPSNWEVGEKYCDVPGCSFSLTLERSSQMDVFISSGSNLETGGQFESIEAYLEQLYPDKSIIATQPTADNTTTINSVEEDNSWVLIQLPNKKIVSITFSDTGLARETVLNSFTVAQ